MDYQVVFPDEDGVLSFTIQQGTMTKKVIGKQALVQIVYVELLKTPGQDILSPTDGGGVISMAGGYNIGVEEQSEVYADITSRVRIVEKQILSDQINKNLLSSEKLQRLTVRSVNTIDGNPTQYAVEIDIISADENITSPVVMISQNAITI